MKNILIIITIFMCFFNLKSNSLSKVEEKKLHIIYYNSETSESYWWRTSSDIMEAACRNLGMELEVIYVNRNPFKMIKDFKEKAQSDKPPDAVIFQNLRTTAIKMLEIAEKNKIPAFIFNAGLTDDQTIQYGKPREHFKYWIGEMFPDDNKAGYDLALKLFNEAIRLGLTDKDGNVHFLAVTGTKTDTAAIEREKGLLRALKEEKKIILDHTISCNWKRDESQKAFEWLNLRYPTSKVFWSANDPMALGVLDGISKKNLVAGKDLIIGSMDWVPEALEQVQNGNLVTSLDGHFMETAWVAVLIYDYFHGKDFASESLSFNSTMTSLSNENISNYLKYFKPDNYSKVDFSLFSKSKNKEIKKYDFNFNDVLIKMSSN